MWKFIRKFVFLASFVAMCVLLSNYIDRRIGYVSENVWSVRFIHDTIKLVVGAGILAVMHWIKWA